MIFNAHIAQNPFGQYVIDNTQARPAFLAAVTGAAGYPGPAGGNPYCHIVSFDLIAHVLRDVMNVNANIAAGTTDLLNTFHNIPAPAGVTAVQAQTVAGYNVDLTGRRNNLNAARNLANARAFLSRLNSCPYNLRFPANQALNWNPSVGSAYDPIQWCTVINGNVVCTQGGAVAPPSAWGAHPQTVGLPLLPHGGGAASNGFYLTNSRDHYLINRMYVLGQYIAQTYLFFYKAFNGAHHYLYSSSNNFAIPANPQQSNLNLYSRFPIGTLHPGGAGWQIT